MNINTTKRDIRHELADIIALLGDEHTTTNYDSTPEDIADYITSNL